MIGAAALDFCIPRAPRISASYITSHNYRGFNMPGISGMEAQELNSNSRFLFRQPRALQWFEGGKLMRRQDGERQAGRFELFLDLLYVAILSNFADSLTEDISGAKLVKYIVSRRTIPPLIAHTDAP